MDRYNPKTIEKCLNPPKWTFWKMRFLGNSVIFRFHVNFQDDFFLVKEDEIGREMF